MRRPGALENDRAAVGDTGRKSMRGYMISAVLASVTCFAYAGAANAFSVTSPDIKPGGKIALEQVFNSWGCSGKNVSPELKWSGAPKATKSFAISVYDPDAPTGSGFWHWWAVNIPADTTSVPKGAGDDKGSGLPAGAIQAHNDYGAVGFGGPCPPKGKPHRYIFTIFALDVPKLDVDANATAAVFGFNANAHSLAKATLTGLWGQ
jgi:Raf kinase inhibitor-like YbhB/YbcL family protein